MATRPFELTRLDPNTFEHMVNQLAMRELGAGVTGFAPGSDGGRDGWFVGPSTYPSLAAGWSGTWYIQSKFHAPHLSTDAQAWLRRQADVEIGLFSEGSGNRVWPDNWIIATNVDPSAVPETGTHDHIMAAVEAAMPSLKDRVHIWGGEKIIALLTKHPDVARHYGAFVTSGEVLSAIVNQFEDDRASVDDIVRDLIVTQFGEHQFTKLEQAGSSADSRPGIHKLFVDLPFQVVGGRRTGLTIAALSHAAAEAFALPNRVPSEKLWNAYFSSPKRAQYWFLRGGPGQGKSTVTQFLSQINRAALIDASPYDLRATVKVRDIVDEIKQTALEQGIWPVVARVPVQIELRHYAQWFGAQAEYESKGVLAYLAHRLSLSLTQAVQVGTIKRAFSKSRWLFIFDGLDEVPGDVKDGIATEITNFCDHVLFRADCDYMIICTSRPQGYSGQFEGMDPITIELSSLNENQALECAKPVLAIDRTVDEQNTYITILSEALQSHAIREIMTTPLQCHIMAVVVRDGGRPPERRWLLFTNFYQVIKKRESNTNLPDKKIAKLLREGDELIKALHNRLGFELHFRAELSSGAQTSITKAELRIIVSEIVNDLQETGVEETIETLMDATTERLVLVNTPESGSAVRFDIRPLQEFFAAEYLYETAPDKGFLERVQAIAGDSHWREVIHFLMSALIEQKRRSQLAEAVQVFTSLDSPPDDSHRFLAKALCLGGIASARLLREGVLEADRRVRNQFRNAINLLLASTEADIYLGDVAPPYTRDWLAALITQSIDEKAPSETVGAIVTAGGLKDLNDERESALVAFIAKQSVDYKTVVLRKLRPLFADEENVHEGAEWVLRSVIIHLADDEWHKLSTSALSSAFDIIGANKDAAVVVSEKLGFPLQIMSKIMQFFDEPDRYSGEPESEELQFGLITKSTMQVAEGLDTRSWTKEELSQTDQIRGIFKLVAKLAIAAYAASDGTITEFNETIEGSFSILKKLPSSVREMFLSDCVIENPAECSIDNALKKVDIGKRHLFLLSGEKDEVHIDWEGIVNAYPSFIPSQLCRIPDAKANERLTHWMLQDNNEAVVADAYIAEQGSFVASLEEARRVEKTFPKLGAAMLDALRTRKAFSAWNHYRAQNSYVLGLPDDVPYLPNFVRSLIDYHEHRSSIPGANGTAGRPSDLIRRIYESIPVGVDLSDISNDNNIANDIRIAALTMQIAVAVYEGYPVEPIIFEIKKLIDASNDHSSLRAILHVLTIPLRDGSEVVISFINDMLGMIKTDIIKRVELESVLQNWREITRAPVSESIESGIWY